MLLAGLAACQPLSRMSPAASAPSLPATSGVTTSSTLSQGGSVAPLATALPSPAAADIPGLVERLTPTVVNITSTSHRVALSEGMPIPFGPFGPFGQPDGPEQRSEALGSGFIVDPTGYIVTNAHVIEQADDVRVRLADSRELPAHIIGKDSKLDLALLKVDGVTGLSAVTLGDSDKLRVGDWVLAIGNPYGLGNTVTLGITSAKDRSIGAGPYDSFIQTDASINPGNSGGALFNLRGELVGIPTAIRVGAQGIGFAIPVNTLRDALSQLRDHGAVVRGKLGVHVQPMSSDLATALGMPFPHGALVATVEPSSSGAKAGLKSGDVVLSVNGAEVAHSEDLPRLVARNAPGSTITLQVLRNGQTLTLSAKLDKLEDSTDDGQSGDSTPPRTTPHGRFGLELEDTHGGVRVHGLSGQSVAAGQLVIGDVIEEANHKPVASASDLVRSLEATPSGGLVLLQVRHGSERRFVALRAP